MHDSLYPYLITVRNGDQLDFENDKIPDEKLLPSMAENIDLPWIVIIKEHEDKSVVAHYDRDLFDMIMLLLTEKIVSSSITIIFDTDDKENVSLNFKNSLPLY